MKVSNTKNYNQTYRIVFQGQLDERRLTWFPGMDVICRPDGKTMLSGTVMDAAALHGMLARIGDLDLPLLLVWRVDYPIDEEISAE